MGTARAWRHEAWRRVTLIVLVVTLTLAGCTYAKEEPGLFGQSEPSPSDTSEPDLPPVENPELPVLGEATWTTGDGTYIEFRIAVHAVRRIKGATVLDWSITPLAGLNLLPGDAIRPSVNLGLSRYGEGNVNIFLVDAFGHKVYRPLTHADPAELQHCLCSPIWLAQRNLRVGETRLLQVTFPELPAALETIDVDIATVPIFWHVPVSPRGQVPVRTNATVLARRSDLDPILATSRRFHYSQGGQQLEIQIDRVISSTTFTSLEWTIQSLTKGDGLEFADHPPIARGPVRGVLDYNPVSATGPRVKARGAESDTALSTRWITTKVQGKGAVECLCSDLRLWATSLRSPNQQATVVTNLPALPRFIGSVDIILPGLQTLTNIPVIRARDGSLRAAGPVEAAVSTWTYAPSEPPAGWVAMDWPTPLPDPAQLPSYTATVDHLR
ncbi:hypothetical protein GCM10009841_35650 [Microlunatus panaciterrae]|uniref:Uncharacterized protein n=1 Tax=Microlunatus panaciterrae TaxID=400768 RepID=A0ABS2RGU7_9ACTN|nr:hypothetical protein [Microlunatus panaciterrae]MBM7798223.1 hypothetical protein [Microlunatus panaciterrae]